MGRNTLFQHLHELREQVLRAIRSANAYSNSDCNAYTMHWEMYTDAQAAPDPSATAQSIAN